MDVQDKTGVRGFFRIQITDDEGTVFGDSGWHENQITNIGFQSYLARTLGALAGSSQVTHMALGSGGAPAAGDTTLAGEVEVRAAVTAATNGSTRVDFTATFASTASFVTSTRNISNVALAATSTAAAATIFAGNTYASSSVATNQNVNATYGITFA